MRNNMRLLFLTGIIIGIAANMLEAAPLKVLRLSNKAIEIEVVPRLGGRLTALRRPGEKNLLLVTPENLESVDDSTIPELRRDQAKFRKFYGHVVWLAPQTDWWRQQDFDQEGKRRGEMWPPDPWLEFGNYRIVKQTKNEIVLEGPHSKCSGVTLTKTYSLGADATVKLTVTAVNTGNKTVRWGLWSNTRIASSAKVYVPANPKKHLHYQMDTWDAAHERLITYNFTNGFFHFNEPEKLSDKITAYKGKVGFTPSAPVIAAFIGSELLLKCTTPVSRVAPEHYPVEIYREINSKNSESVMELEFHGNYKILDPRERITMVEIWQLFSPRLPDQPLSHTVYLKNLLNNSKDLSGSIKAIIK